MRLVGNWLADDKILQLAASSGSHAWRRNNIFFLILLLCLLTDLITKLDFFLGTKGGWRDKSDKIEVIISGLHSRERRKEMCNAPPSPLCECCLNSDQKTLLCCSTNQELPLRKRCLPLSDHSCVSTILSDVLQLDFLTVRPAMGRVGTSGKMHYTILIGHGIDQFIRRLTLS